MTMDAQEAELLLAYLADELTDEEVGAITERLKREPALAEKLLLLAGDEGSISRWAGAGASSDERLASDGRAGRGREWVPRFNARHRVFASLAGLAVAALVAAVLIWLFRSPPAAVLVRSYNVQWRGTVPSGHARLEAGDTLQIVSGLVELSMSGSTRVFIEGPSHAVVESPTALRLHHGTVSVDVASGEEGFTILTDNGVVRDLGTRFAVVASPEEGTRVEVYSGQVEALLPGAVEKQQSPVTLARGRAAHLSAETQRVEFSPFGDEKFQGVKHALTTRTVEASDDHFVRNSDEWSGRNAVPNSSDNPELLMKTSPIDSVARKVWIKFRVGANARRDEEAYLVFRHAEPNHKRDFVGHVAVYALQAGFAFGPVGTDWSEDGITWNNAPGNLTTSNTRLVGEAVRLGQIDLNTRSPSQPTGTCYSMRLPRLGDFLQPDGTVTVALTVEKQYEHSPVLLIASSEHREIPGPELTYSVATD